MIFPGDDYARAMQEALDASRAEAEKYKRVRQSPAEPTKCELCKQTGTELKEYGQPVSYYACVDVRSCEAMRKRRSLRD